MTCIECRRKKVRCSGWRVNRCLRCERLNLNCIKANDGRRERIGNNEINALKARIIELEGIIDDKCLPILPILSNLKKSNETDPALHPKPKVYKKVELLLKEFEYSKNIFRSLVNYDDNYIDNDNDNYNNRIEFQLLHKDYELIHDLQSFFQWFYPDITFFLPREPFLIELYHGDKESCLATKSLAFAAASLGSLARGNPDRGFKLHSIAVKISENKINVSLANMQIWLLLAVWDLYAGDIDSAWVRIGVAARISEGILPSTVINNNKVNNGAARIASIFRGRIFWGAFILERLVSVMWGEKIGFIKSAFRFSNPTPTERVPDLEWVAREGVFNFAPGMVVEVAAPLRAIVNLIKLVESSKEEEANNYCPFQVWRKSLEKDLAWTREDLQERALVPPRMVHVYFYYAYKLATAVVSMDSLKMIPIEDILDAAELVVSPFINHHGAGRSSVLLLATSVAALELLLSSKTRGTSGTVGTVGEQHNRHAVAAWLLVRGLEQCGRAGMGLARRAATRFEPQVRKLFGPELGESGLPLEPVEPVDAVGTVGPSEETEWADWPDWAEWAEWGEWGEWEDWASLWGEETGPESTSG